MAETAHRIVLASASPRRRELLQQAGWQVRVRPAPVNERRLKGETPRQYVLRLARLKAKTAAGVHVSRWPILAADTTVAQTGPDGQHRIYGKPASTAGAKRMLRQLSGRWHEVWTGIALQDPASGKVWSRAVKTRVRFTEMNNREIEMYARSGEPFDKAGGYALQGRAAIFIPEIAGSPSNVIGLPLAEFYRIWKLFEAKTNARGS